MARINLARLASAFAGLALIAPPAPATEPPPPGPSGEHGRRLLEKLPPEQREHFRQNMESWSKLSPEQRRELREKEMKRREERRREFERFLERLGIAANDPRRPQLFERYLQERRRIEQTLREEMQTRRKTLIDATISQFQREFPPTPGTTPQPTPAPGGI
jgi:hypothetical protein